MDMTVDKIKEMAGAGDILLEFRQIVCHKNDDCFSCISGCCRRELKIAGKSFEHRHIERFMMKNLPAKASNFCFDIDGKAA